MSPMRLASPLVHCQIASRKARTAPTRQRVHPQSRDQFGRLRPIFLTLMDRNSSRGLWTNGLIRKGVKLEFSRPGQPTDNAYIESFNGRLRQECLDQHWFETLEEARRTIERWRREYNETRPHSALDNETPEDFKENWQRARRPNEAGFLTF
jgi:transposase InsO family protein